MQSSISADIRALLIERINGSNPAEVLRIAAGLASNEQIELLCAAARYEKPTIPAAAASTKLRFVNLDGDGKPAAAGAWVFDRNTGLIWARGVLNGEYTYS